MKIINSEREITMTIMKKILTVLVLSVLALSMTFSAFAADGVGSFIQSPSANQAPTLVEGGSDDHDCEEPLRIVSYADRDKLPEDLRKALEAVYADVIGTKNIITLCPALKDIAADLGIPGTNLEVSDLFDISDVCGEVDGKFDIVLKAETLENFVGLLHYVDGEYQLVENAVVEDRDGELHLIFSTEGLSPFAIVVDSGEVAPVEDNSVLIGVLTVVAVAEAAALIAILVKFLLSKKVG